MGIRRYVKASITGLLNNLQQNINTVPQLLLNRAIQESADYASAHMVECLMFNKQVDLRNYCITLMKDFEGKDNLFLEFGVFKGTSINLFSSKLPQLHFDGFDSFEGLQENWTGWSLPKGAFNLNGNMPKVSTNVTLHKGWFNKTLPVFLETNNTKQIKFVHIDCDTYESTKYIFEKLEDKIVSGTYILFDEYFGYRGWQLGEYKAFQEFINHKKIKYQYLGFSNYNVLIQIL